MHRSEQERRPRWAVLGLLCTCIGIAGGCARGSNFLTGGPTVGQLKTSLSHLEYENQQLKRSVAKLQAENRSFEDRLVQEQIDNGDLAARLDDARNALRDRGLDPDVRLGARRGSDAAGAPDAEFPDQSADDPSNASSGRKRRRTPFARISGSSGSTSGDHGDDQPQGGSQDGKPARSGRPPSDTLDHHSLRDGSIRWLPVADGSDTMTTQIR